MEGLNQDLLLAYISLVGFVGVSSKHCPVKDTSRVTVAICSLPKESSVHAHEAAAENGTPRHLAAYPHPATARRAMTPTRWARYSALAWISELRPVSGIVMSLIASGLKERVSAASISGTRKTQGPAPVTATRTPPPVRATKTPTIA